MGEVTLLVDYRISYQCVLFSVCEDESEKGIEVVTLELDRKNIFL